MSKMIDCGRRGALRALAGEAISPMPVALFTWEFDYLWRVAGLQPWQLVCGDPETWHRSHLALLDRHQPDLIWYSGAGASATPPRLIEEDREKWAVEDGNGHRSGLLKGWLIINGVLKMGFSGGEYPQIAPGPDENRGPDAGDIHDGAVVVIPPVAIP